MKQTIILAAWTVLFMLGVGCAAYGLWLAWHPLGYIAPGVLVCVVAWGGGIEQMGEGSK